MSVPLISAVVLAAGMSTRMEGAHKLTLDVAGKPMVRRTVQAVLGIAPVETIIVTGFAAEAVRGALAGLDVRFAHNADYANGQPGSVAEGVKSLRDYCHAVMIVPGDQVLLTPTDLQNLIAAYATCGRSILVPFHNSHRGNPIIFAAHFIPRVVSGGVNMGCRRLIETNNDDVAVEEFASDSFVVDCDTPAQYKGLLTRFTARHIEDTAHDAD